MVTSVLVEEQPDKIVVTWGLGEPVAFERNHRHWEPCDAPVVELDDLWKQDACARSSLLLLGAKHPQGESGRRGSAVDEPREVFRLPLSDDPVLVDLGMLVDSEWLLTDIMYIISA
jgi:hypothetical protein